MLPTIRLFNQNILPILNKSLGYNVEIDLQSGYDDAYDERINQSYIDNDDDRPEPNELICLHSITRKDNHKKICPLFNEGEDTASMSIYDYDVSNNTLSYIVTTYNEDYAISIDQLAKGIDLLFKLDKMVENNSFSTMLTILNKNFMSVNQISIEDYGVKPALCAYDWQPILLEGELLQEVVVYANDNADYFYTSYNNKHTQFTSEFFIMSY